jgi:hypothetical protein
MFFAPWHYDWELSAGYGIIPDTPLDPIRDTRHRSEYIETGELTRQREDGRAECLRNERLSRILNRFYRKNGATDNST